jgi:hypothetical protein
MKMEFDPALDRPYPGPIPTPDFSESQQWNFFDGQFGVMCHIGAMPGDIKLWHNAFAIGCPDGSTLATKIVGRGPLDGFGAHAVHSITLEPYKAWRVGFDGALRRYDPASLQAGPSTDGRHIPVRVELDIIAAHPVWDPGANAEHVGGDKGLFASMSKMHHEQALTCTGFIEIDGKRTAYQASGHRDHSFGPRDLSKLQRALWVNGTFETGWSFLQFEGELSGLPLMKRGGLFEGGKIIECLFDHQAELTSSAPEPRLFTMRMVIPGQADREIEVRVKGGANWTSVGPTEWCLGTLRGDPRNYLFTHYFAELSCHGEKGHGFVDRGINTALLA